LIYRFNSLLTKIQQIILEYNKLILLFIQRGTKSRIANTILKLMNKVRKLTLPNIKIYYRAKIINSVWYWQKNQQVYQRTRTKSTTNRLMWTVNQSEKEPRLHNREKTLFSKNGTRTTGPPSSKIKYRDRPYTCAKRNAKWPTALNIKKWNFKIPTK
jgi:hypothetical protein